MASKPVVGVLSLQGAFREHVKMLAEIGAEPREIRQKRDLPGINSIVIPGGESTTMGKLLNELGIMEPLKADIAAGMPVFGTCAGLILLCGEIEDSAQPRIGALNATARRNAFGRQVDSFEAYLPIPALGQPDFPCVFIRAPLIMEIGANVKVLASLRMEGRERPVAVLQDNILATSFHPELTRDLRMHKFFLKLNI